MQRRFRNQTDRIVDQVGPRHVLVVTQLGDLVPNGDKTFGALPGWRTRREIHAMLRTMIAAVVVVVLTLQTASAKESRFVKIVTAAETVVIAEAVDSRSNEGTTNVTQITFRVEQTLTGPHRVLLLLEFFAGTVEVGDRAVLFVSGESSGGVRQHSHFPINRSPDGIEYVTLDDRRAFSAVDQIGSPIMASAVALPTMSLDAFGAEITRLLRRRKAPASAGDVSVDTIPTSVVDPAITLLDVPFPVIPFPPRDQTLNFFLSLESEYRDTLRRSRTNQGFVDAEGSAVWFPEWLRYVLNQCSVMEAANRVLMQIRGRGTQPVCGTVPAGAINFPPRDQSLDFLNTLDTLYRDELNRTVELSYIDLEGKAVWLQEYLRYRVNGCGEQEALQKVLSQIRTGVIEPICGPLTTFGPGQHLVGTDIAAGRYFSDPVKGCSWERLSGFGGTLSDVIANEYIGYDAPQEIVDILPSELAFGTDGQCGTWFDTPRGGASPTSIRPGNWLVGSQVVPGTYRTQAMRGCSWERLRDFTGEYGAIIANDRVPFDGQQFVTISGSDVGFQTDLQCGTWTRVSLLSAVQPSRQSPEDIRRNWELNRRQHDAAASDGQ